MRQQIASRGLRLAREVQNLPRGRRTGGSATPPPATNYLPEAAEEGSALLPDDGGDPGPEDVGQHKGLQMSKNTFLMQGTFLLTMLCFLPVWDSLALLESPNYTIFMGKGLPLMVIAICLISVLGFMLMAEATLSHWRSTQASSGPRASVQNMAVAMAMLITMFGLGLVFTSMPLSTRALQTYNSLMFTCAAGSTTHPVYEVYSNLLALRLTADCKDMYSVEECVGFQPSLEAEFLKYAEQHLRCTGFCAYQLTTSALLEGNNTLTAEEIKEGLDLAQKASQLKDQSAGAHSDSAVRKRKVVRKGAGTLAKDGAVATVSGSGAYFSGEAPQVPTLFSKANLKISCEHAAAWNVMTLSRDIALSMWYLGIGLIIIAMIMTVWDWKL
mmetsp:Transcript_45829/g.84040  ORF Transcript_45829/g.84040 Transcript_45829/m.84040 type:complete len:385 (+) Transcript_45829:142-1296(+)